MMQARIARARGAGNVAVLLGVLVALVLLGGLVDLLGSPITQRVVTVGMVYLVAVVGLYIFSGNSGIFSFGHVGFIAIGAYLSAILTMTPAEKATALPVLSGFLATAHPPLFVDWLICGAVASVVAAAFGIPLMRMVGIAAAIGTFAFLVIIYTVASNWSWTGAAAGLSAVPLTTSIGAAMAWAVAAIVVAIAFQQSKTGLRLRAARDEPVAARASGIGVFRERQVAFIISAFFCGVAGALYGGFVGAFSPDAFYLDLTFLLVSMLVVGGSYSLTGAVTGTVVLTVAVQAFLGLEGGIRIGGLVHIPGKSGEEQLLLGVLLLVILLVRPRGITNGAELDLKGARALRERLRSRRGRARGGPDAPDVRGSKPSEPAPERTAR